MDEGGVYGIVEDRHSPDEHLDGIGKITVKLPCVIGSHPWKYGGDEKSEGKSLFHWSLPTNSPYILVRTLLSHSCLFVKNDY